MIFARLPAVVAVQLRRPAAVTVLLRPPAAVVPASARLLAVLRSWVRLPAVVSASARLSAALRARVRPPAIVSASARLLAVLRARVRPPAVVTASARLSAALRARVRPPAVVTASARLSAALRARVRPPAVVTALVRLPVVVWISVRVLAVASVLVLGWQSPASAHAGGLVATDARGRVVALNPAVPGLSVAAIEDGARLRLTNHTGGPVTVPGGGGAATPAVVAAGATLTWADDRATPVGRSVRAGVVSPWSLMLSAGGTPVTVTGELVGAARPLAAPWWVAAAVLIVAVPVAGRRIRRPDLVLTWAGLVAMAASITHVVGSTLAVQSAPPVGTFVNAAGINLLAWPLILGGAVAVFRGRPAGVLAVCAGAALTAVFVLPDVTSFHRAVLPFAGPAVLERVLVLLALGVGVGVAAAGAPVLRRLAAAAA